MPKPKESAYQAYLKSDCWKCTKSPSGAHRWVETGTLPRGRAGFHCVHCGEERHFEAVRR